MGDPMNDFSEAAKTLLEDTLTQLDELAANEWNQAKAVHPNLARSSAIRQGHTDAAMAYKDAAALVSRVARALAASDAYEQGQQDAKTSQSSFEEVSIPPLDTRRSEKLAELGAQVQKINEGAGQTQEMIANAAWVDEVVAHGSDIGYLGWLGGDIRRPCLATLLNLSTGDSQEYRWRVLIVNNLESLRQPDAHVRRYFKEKVAVALRDNHVSRIDFGGYDLTNPLGRVVTGTEVTQGWLKTGRLARITDDARAMTEVPNSEQNEFVLTPLSPSGLRPPRLEEAKLYQSRVLKIIVAPKPETA